MQDDLTWCGGCQEHKPRSDFYERYGTATGKCRACSVAAVRKYQGKRKQFQARDLLTDADREKLLERQGGGCAVCGAERSSNGNRLSADHDHSTSLFRGLLCHHCNVGLGYFSDDPERLRRAVAYLNDPPAGAITSEPVGLPGVVEDVEGRSSVCAFEVFSQGKRVFFRRKDGSMMVFRSAEFFRMVDGMRVRQLVDAGYDPLEGAA